MILADKTYNSIKEKSITGRYVTHHKLTNYLKDVADFRVELVGHSVEQRAIESVTLGAGPIKLLLWSQMHGNESTTTKAVLDFINYLKGGLPHASAILERCTIKIIPILNPDGAEAYTRVNANGVDLNRDAQERTQPESQVLGKVYDNFRPDFCFNLHDQRTIYNVGDTNKPATVSFLSPAFNKNRDLSVARLQSMALIHAMSEELQKLIPGQVGRYDDAFNANCVGDSFQMLKTPTILFEAGHFQLDYDRERTREYILIALVKAIDVIALHEVSKFSEKLYFDIPENNKLFFDIVVRNSAVIRPNLKPDDAIGIQFKEVLVKGSIHFELEIVTIGNLSHYFGHQEFDCRDPESLDQLKRKKSLWHKINS